MAIINSISITGSVGQGGANRSADATKVQQRLNDLMPPSRTRLSVDGLIGPKSKAMIADFQKTVCKFLSPDSRVDPNGRTLAALNDPASAAAWGAGSVTPPPPVRRQVVQLHFRSISLTDVTFEDQFTAAVQTFAQYGIDVKFMSGKSAALSEADRKRFNRVDTSCVAGDDEWSALQKVTNDAPKTDICVVFVGQLWDPNEKPGSEMFLGCGAFRPGAPACAVAANGGKYDMAHEVGHVLGLAHDTTVNNLMHPTQAAYPTLPVLTAAQQEKLRSSPLCR